MAHQQRVAIRVLARREIGADQAARAGPVLHQDGLRQGLLQVRRDQPRHGIDETTGRELADQPDRAARGPGLRLGVSPGGDEGCRAGGEQITTLHGVSGRFAGKETRAAEGASRFSNL